MERGGGQGSRKGGTERGQFQRLLPKRVPPFQGFPMKSSYSKHQCVRVCVCVCVCLYVSDCVGDAEGSGKDVIFGQERDMEAEEGFILATECEKRWIQERPFKTGACFTESAVQSEVTPRPHTGGPSFHYTHLLCTVVAHWSGTHHPHPETVLPLEVWHKVFLSLHLTQRWARGLASHRCLTQAK